MPRNTPLMSLLPNMYSYHFGKLYEGQHKDYFPMVAPSLHTIIDAHQRVKDELTRRYANYQFDLLGIAAEHELFNYAAERLVRWVEEGNYVDNPDVQVFLDALKVYSNNLLNMYQETDNE